MDPSAAWALFYSSLVSFTLHPGYLRPGAERPDLDALAKMADDMLRRYLERIEPWQQS